MRGGFCRGKAGGTPGIMSENDFLGFVRDVSRDPFGQIKKYAAQGRRMAGYMCTYVPEEFLYAAGLLPIRLLGRATQITKADRHLQSYCCSHVRGFLEDYMDGAYNDISAVLFAYTCDTMQSFYDIFKMNFPEKYIANLNFPVRLDTKSAYKYALTETLRFKEGIEKFTGKKIGAAELENAVNVYNKNRELVGKLYDLHSANPDIFPSATLLQVSLASMFMDKAELNPMIEKYLAGAGAGPAGGAARKRLILIGSINLGEDIYTLADEYGATIANDDMCTGRRYFQGLVEKPTDEGILSRYYNRPHCAAKHLSNTSRGEYIVKLAKAAKADAAIFDYLKFCDPHAFDYPYMRKMLESAGFRTHLIEVEQSLGQSGQLRTKMQAFIETLK